MADLFSVIAMFILFREALEACIVVAILLQMCQKLGLQRLKKQVWFGALSGVGVALCLGVAFIIVFYVLRSRVFSGAGQNIFKGYINLVAACLITLLAFAMLRFLNYEKKWQRKLERAAGDIETNRSSRWTFFLLAFVATLREGIETVIFLGGVSGSVPITSIPLAGLVGILLGIAAGLVLYYTGRQIASLKWFFWLSCLLLFAIAAGLVSTGMTAWQAVGWWGTTEPDYDTPWWNKVLWDWSGCCSDDVTRNKFFGLMRALFGYQATPTFISVFSYFGFWLLVAFDFAIKWRRGTLMDAEGKAKRREAARRKKLGLAPEDPEGVPKGAAGESSRALNGKEVEEEEKPGPAPGVLPHGFHPLHKGGEAHQGHNKLFGKGGSLFGGNKARQPKGGQQLELTDAAPQPATPVQDPKL